MSHDEASELLGAYVLDAVEPDEALAVEATWRAARAVGPSSTPA